MSDSKPRFDRQTTAGELALWHREMQGPPPAEKPPPAVPATVALAPREGAAARRPAAPAVAVTAADDLARWREALAGVLPLRGGPAIPPPPRPDAPAAPPTPAGRATAPMRLGPPGRESSALIDPARPVDIDRRTWIRLRRGQYPIDARLDLHGLTQAEAYALLGRFLLVAQGRGNRCVLVITGRGLRRGGTLRAMTPRWLDTVPVRSRVLAYAPARQQHGGEGALYVLLRRAG